MKKPENFWGAFLWDNSRWMVASLLLAFGLWIIAVFQTDPVQKGNYPRLISVEYQLDENMIITNGQLTEGAQVTLRAPASVWDSLRTDQIEIIADLTNLTVGQHRVVLEAQLVNGLRGEVVDISPRWVDVTLEERVSKRLPIRPQVNEEPPSGFTYSPPTCSLTEVTAQGPSTVLENAIVVARLSLKDYRNPVSLNVALQATNELGRALTSITLETSQVECQVEINPIAGVSELSVVPVVDGFPPSGYIYEGFNFTPRTIIVTGNPNAIRDMNGIANTEAIDLSTAVSNFERIVTPVLPEGVRLLPATQTVTVSIKIGTVQGSRQYANILLQVEGLRPDLKVELATPNVTVFVVGPQPLLETLTDQDLKVVIDVEGDTPGTYQKTATANVILPDISDDLQLTVQPPEIGVTITPLNPTPTPNETADVLPDTLPSDR